MSGGIANQHHIEIDLVVNRNFESITKVEVTTRDQIRKFQQYEDSLFSVPRSEYTENDLNEMGSDRVFIHLEHMKNVNSLNKIMLTQIEQILGVSECSLQKFNHVSFLSETKSV